jgi:nucleotide-binding universal stress UspA family protein
MLQRLLVPLDGSPFAEGALPYAEALARRTGAVVQLVRASLVRQPPLENTGEARMVADERAYLVKVVERLGAQRIAATVTLQHAEPAEAIVGQARQWGADLIVMATHERGLVGRAIFGSVTAGVLEAAPAPVLLVQRGDAPAFAESQRVLLPLDGSPLAEAALPVARTFAQIFDAPIVLVTALPRRTSTDEASEHPLHAHLQEVAGQLSAAGLTVEIETRGGGASRVICDVAEERGATLIAMATRTHSGLQRMILGDTADAVLRATEVPLVLVRPTLEGREE